MENKGYTEAVAISNIKINELEEFFNKHKGSRPTKKYLYDLVGGIEFSVIAALEQYCIKEPRLPVGKFIADLAKELIKYNVDVKKKYDELIKISEKFAKKDDCEIDTDVYERLLNDELQEIDAKHIASASDHQKTKRDVCVFVTLDRNSIIIKKDLIFKESKIICCDPIYAIHNI